MALVRPSSEDRIDQTPEPYCESSGLRGFPVWFGVRSSPATRCSSLEKAVPFLHYDKLVHYGAYAGLAFLSLSAFERRRGIVVALSMILLGAAMEFLQHFSPGRSPDTTDAIVNTLGVLSGISVGLLVTGALARDASPRRLPK
jgi:VanZ family protein